jgi:DNA-binding transcriptional MocR family regulator
VNAMHRQVDAQSPIPIRWQLTAPRKHLTGDGSAQRNPALPSIREVVGLLGINPNTRVRAIEDLKRSGYRPLLPLTAAAPSSIPRVPPAQGATRETLCGEKGFRQRVGKAPRAHQEGVSVRGATTVGSHRSISEIPA